MKIVRIQGGLGNQMFQFAFGENLRRVYNIDIYYDISFFSDQDAYLKAGNQFRNLELIEIFPEVKSFLNDNDGLLMQYAPLNNLFNKIFRRFSLQHIGSNFFTWIHDPQIQYLNISSRLLLRRYIYLEGYWQNLKYFAANEKVVRNFFKFNSNVLDIGYNKSIINEIKNANISVSVHIRRGDYLNSSLFICNGISYYQAAIKHIADSYPSAVFYLFTDDIDWIKNNMGVFKTVTDKINVISRKGLSAEDDLYMMSLCKHNITSNSTFSWWGAYLNTFKNKIMIAPEEWTSNPVINKYIQTSLLNNFILIRNI